MSLHGVRMPLGVLVFLACTVPGAAATYKWVDEHGSTHYGDVVPARHAGRAEKRRDKPAAAPVRNRQAHAAGNVPGPEAPEARQDQERRQFERRRRDSALLRAYANEDEIELARSRELRRNEDTFRLAIAGLAGSASREDRGRVDALIDQGRQESDRINARFDDDLARFRELTRAIAVVPTGTAAAQETPIPRSAQHGSQTHEQRRAR